MACSSVFLARLFCQVEVYRCADQRMFLTVREAIAVQQIGLLPVGQAVSDHSYSSRRDSCSSIMLCGCMA